MKTLVLILLLIPSYLWAACTWVGNAGTAASGSTTEIAACISNASSMTGAVTITIPSGSVTHTSAVSVNMSSGFTNVTSLTIQGASKTGTAIANSGWNINAPAAKKVRLSNMTLTGSTVSSLYGMINVTGGTKPSSGGGFRIDNLVMNGSGSRAIYVYNYTYGLIDSITSSWGGQWSINENGGSSDGGNASWLADDTIGGADNIFIENCTLTNTDASYIWFVMDQYGGSRVVARYNILNNYHFGGHDAVIVGYRANRHYEAYNNYFTTNFSWGIESFVLRGGTGFIYNNRTYASASLTPYDHGNSMVHIYNRRNGTAGDGVPWNAGACNSVAEYFCKTRSSGGKPINCTSDTTCGGIAGSCVQMDGNIDGTGYPCRDQFGMGKDQTYQPVLFWNNKTLFYNGTESSYTPFNADTTHIKLNRDYCYAATTMPATCNGVTTNFLAYTCPHPLTGSTGSCDSSAYGTAGYNIAAEDDTTPPVISSPTPSTQQLCYVNPTNVTVGVTTNENATCRISTSDWGAAAFADHGSQMTTTGALAHTNVVSSTCDTTISRYVRCIDASNNVSSTALIQYPMAGAEDTAAPTVTPEIIAAGNKVVWTANESIKYGAGSYGGVTMSCTGGAVTSVYESGNNSSTVTFSLSRVVLSTETCTNSYTQPTNGWEDQAGNDMVTFATRATTNSSTQTATSDNTQIWADSVMGTGGTAAGDGRPVELGVEFLTSQAGKITHIKWHKQVDDKGTHVVNLWGVTGTLLATRTVSGESATGMQTMALTTPIEIFPNTAYVASYFSPLGYYTSTASYFASSYNSSIFTASTGRYGYGVATRFPSTTNIRNYWVDIEFVPGYLVSPSIVSGAGCSISGERVGLAGEQPTTTVTLSNGWNVASVAGTCGGSGSLSGTEYTYTPTGLSADCTILVSCTSTGTGATLGSGAIATLNSGAAAIVY